MFRGSIIRYLKTKYTRPDLPNDIHNQKEEISMKVKCDGREFEIKNEDNGKNLKFEMRSRRRSIVWGVAFLVAALLLIAGAVMDTMGINAEIPFFRIALCGLLLGLVVKSLT